MDPKEKTMFACSKCECPLQGDEDFKTPSQHTLAELNLPAFPGSHLARPSAEDAEIGCIDTCMYAMSLSENTDPGVVADTFGDHSMFAASVTKTAHGHRLRVGMKELGNKNKSDGKVTAELFGLASNTTAVDHPLCGECVGRLLEEKHNIKAGELQKLEGYENLLKEMKEPSDDVAAEFKKEAAALALLEAEVAHILREKALARADLAERRRQSAALEQESEKYFIERAKNKVVSDSLDLQKFCLHQVRYDASTQLARLKRKSVLHRAFTIWQEDHLVTINGLRLGRTQTIQTPWLEIHTALGHVAHLMVSLARVLDVEYTCHRPVPLGAHSYVRRLGEREADLRLYKISPMSLMLDHQFDQALCALLECFSQLVAGRDATVPYPVQGSGLNDPQAKEVYSIKLQFNHLESWSKALKFFLTNLKWLITYVSVPQNFDSRQPSPTNVSPDMRR